jgi:hypothetical protein
MYYLNGKPLRIGKSFTYQDITYPGNWLQQSTADARAEINITWVDDPVRADDRFYWNGDVNMPKELEDRAEVDENGDPIYVQVLDNSDPSNPVMVDTTEQLVTPGLKSNWKDQVKHTAGTMLAQTDWMVTRKYERSVDIPADVVTKRAAIITECERLETAIAAAADIDAFIAVVQDQRWPE